jgi:hypothetical protein
MSLLETDERRELAPPPHAGAAEPEDGVIEEARARQRRRRLAAAIATFAALAAALLALQLDGGGSAGARLSPRASHSSLAALAGPSLTAATHLRLVVSENGGPVSVVDLDADSAHTVAGLGVSRTTRAPAVSLAADGGGALAVVTHRTCPTCAGTRASTDTFPDRRTDYLISADGSAKQISSFELTRHQYTAAAFDSTATWVLTWPHRGPCTLALEPAGGSAVDAPCGTPGIDTAAGLWLWNGDVGMLVDPSTGRTLRRIETADALTPLPGDLALESSGGSYPAGLVLVNLATGARRPLRWPSELHFGYTAVPAPHGPLVAFFFGDPAYPRPPHQTVNQAGDLWVLNTVSATFTHVPGFPALESLKQSNVAWTSDDRLVVAAAGGGRTVVGTWRPGQSTLPIRTVPALEGYSSFVPLAP